MGRKKKSMIDAERGSYFTFGNFSWNGCKLRRAEKGGAPLGPLPSAATDAASGHHLPCHSGGFCLTLIFKKAENMAFIT